VVTLARKFSRLARGTQTEVAEVACQVLLESSIPEGEKTDVVNLVKELDILLKQVLAYEGDAAHKEVMVHCLSLIMVSFMRKFYAPDTNATLKRLLNNLNRIAFSDSPKLSRASQFYFIIKIVRIVVASKIWLTDSAGVGKKNSWVEDLVTLAHKLQKESGSKLLLYSVIDVLTSVFNSLCEDTTGNYNKLVLHLKEELGASNLTCRDSI